ncbi:putative disease resistance RPP13-like protein 1 [Ziziphus jujuba]|uniref:Disease resistance RPP13-like protein 1 n=1 Tax=Ziziphus jujuba TaxID=326968 RepID=A0ABM4A0L7_ZIZJJ|nr:putative disease resistance RPP13-like protein 1 [Ziziphus jujuba]
MAELIAGAFFTASFERFSNMVLSGEVLKFVSAKKLNDRMLKKFKTMLLSVKALLNDAEKKQISDPDVRQWLDELRDTMYDAEDLAYEIQTEPLRCKIEGGQSGSRIFQVFNFTSRFNIKNLEDRIVEIFHTLEGVVNQKDLLGLTPSVGVHLNRSSSSSPQLLPVEEESDIYGRDDDKAAIVKLLLSDDDHDDVVGGNKISVIPIVGMGGIGKTTLAHLVFNDVNVVKKFDLKAWVTVSDEFDVFTLTKTIFETITGQKDCSIKHPHQLQCELKKAIEGKKFLYVLDDVWNENYNLWDNLRSQFTFGASGSKIIVTTRNEKIGSMMGTVPIYYIGIISNEDSWQLFAKHAFQKIINRSALQEFEEIGRKIVRKCNGLPLAIKSLGGLLCYKKHIDEWEDILNSDTWKMEECNILPTLWLSYNYLPPHLKRCFAYCSIFPKDFEIEKERLILLWMAEDLLLPQENMTLEEIGENYFNDLVSRSFIHYTKGVVFPYYHMHDLVNDLASFVSGEFCLRMGDGSFKGTTGKIRHLSYMTSKSHDIKKLEECSSKSKVLRSLLFDSRILSVQFLANLEQCLKGMRCLRMLSLCENHIMTCSGLVPITISLDLIGNLKLLRYLN